MSNRITRAVNYFKKNGVRKTCTKTVKVMDKLLAEKRTYKYLFSTEEELEKQREAHFEKKPIYSILIPMYNTPLEFFKELVDAIQGQTYEKWELCLADGTEYDTEAAQYAIGLSKNDSRIKYKKLESNEGISGNTNKALEMATGDYIVLCDHDDLLTRDALYYVTRALNEDSYDTLYSDEDKVDMTGKHFFEPSFKPDFNIDFLRGGNYICHMFVTRTEIAQKVRFKEEYDGAQDYDFIFRCCEMSGKVYHIPRILYHWRCHMNSTASNPESKLYAYEAGVKALQANLDRSGIQADAYMSEFWGYYLIRYKQVGNPKVSLISTKQLSSDVLDSIKYENIEHIFIEGDYTAERINNAVKNKVTGDILFFLDPRIVGLQENCFEELLSPLQREDLGSVFAMVKNTENKVFSAGIITGVGKHKIHRAFWGKELQDFGYAMHLFIPQDMKASDLSCVVMRKSSFEEVNGLDERMPMEYSMVDLFLKIGKSGKKQLFNPRAVATIRCEDIDEYRYSECLDECDEFQNRWSYLLNSTDSVYNPNLTQKYANYNMKTWSEIKALSQTKQ